MGKKHRQTRRNEIDGAGHMPYGQDLEFMDLALEQARRAYALNEVPVGAVAVSAGRIVGTGYNRKEKTGDPTAHAEMVALREAADTLGRWRLADVTLYVTLEPCVMCAGAMVQSRLGRLVFGTPDCKGGACGSEYQILQDFRLNHRVNVTRGVLQEEAAALLHEFFAARRARRLESPECFEKSGVAFEERPQPIGGPHGQER